LDGAVEEFGLIDILFNNAGIENTGPTIEESGNDEFQRLIDIDLKAPCAVLHHGASRMRDGGSIINTSSVAGMFQLPGYSQYSAVKSAIISLTKSAALELAPRNIRVNAICPGSVWSEMLPPDHPEVDIVKVICPLERICEAEEVAALVHFLAADDCRYINGAAIPIDGGLTSGLGYPLLEKVLA
jgi:NAD(P)-dependent dehydrogenase (short-subunit alcohol dehydrogenase family)